MTATLEIPRLTTRGDTAEMREMLGIIADNERRGRLSDMNLGRLSRKMDRPHSSISSLILMADNCGWIETRANLTGAVHDIVLTDAGWNLVGNKPLHMA